MVVNKDSKKQKKTKGLNIRTIYIYLSPLFCLITFKF